MSEFVRFLKFIFFIISAGLVEMFSFTILNNYIEVEYWVSYSLSMILVIFWEFSLNRKFTFQSDCNYYLALFKVLIYYLIYIPINLMLIDFFTNLEYSNLTIGLVCMLFNIFTEYVYLRFYVYKDSTDTKVVKV